MPDTMQDTNAEVETGTENDVFLEGLGEETPAPESRETEPAAAAGEDEAQESAAETGKETEKTDGDTHPESAPPETVPLKFLGREYSIPAQAAADIASAMGADREKLIQYIQKGLNYDKVRDDALKEFENREDVKILREYAKASGMTSREYLDVLRQNMEQSQTRQAVETLKQQYPEAPEDALSALAQSKREMETLKNAERERQEAMRQQELAVAEQTRPWEEFFARHSEYAGADDVPQEIYALIREKGLTPNEAYIQMQMDKQEASHADFVRETNKKLEAMEQNLKNAQGSPGSAASDGGVGETDAFLSGLFS